jgi:hypothetical protein
VEVSYALGSEELLSSRVLTHCSAQTMPPIPLDAYRLCVFVRHRKLEVAYTSISLIYGTWEIYVATDSTDPADNLCTPDSLAFLFIIFMANKSKTGGFKFTGILGTIVEDATQYFLVIFTSHFVLEMTLTLGRVSATVSLSGLKPTSSNASIGDNSTTSSWVSRHRFPLYAIALVLISPTTISGNVV